MRRLQLFEFNERSELPEVLRESIIESLSGAIRAGDYFDGAAPLFAAFLREAGAGQVLDCCSGAGEPISVLLDALARSGDPLPDVLMSDLFPNVAALRRVAARYPGRVELVAAPVDATRVPRRFCRPVRTYINCLHHFPPALVRQIFADCVRTGAAIFVLELFPRDLGLGLRALPGLAAAALRNPLAAPRRRPAKAALTYALPLVPALGLFDFVVSICRVHAHDELAALGREVAGASYRWTSASYRYALGGRAQLFCGLPART